MTKFLGRYIILIAERLSWLDILKGIGIILVVIGHVYSNRTVFNWLYSFHMPLFFLAAGWGYKEKTILTDIKGRIQTLLVPYFSFGLLVLLYWQVLERRFRDSENFFSSLYNLTTGLMWFVTALIGVTAMILISQFINENKILQYFGRISLIVLCIHGPVYRIVVKIVSIPLHMGTDAVRENILLAMIVVAITMIICSVAYEVVVRTAPWMIGKKR